jgi:hypothetical protein
MPRSVSPVAFSSGWPKRATRQHDVRRFHLQPDLQLRIARLHPRNRDGHHRRGRGGDRADLHLADEPRAQRRDLVVRLAQVREHHARVADHHFAVERRVHAVRRAVEEAHVEHVFQFLQEARCRRLRHAEHIGGAAHVAFFFHCRQQQQLARLEPRPHEPVRIALRHLVDPKPQEAPMMPYQS